MRVQPDKLALVYGVPLALCFLISLTVIRGPEQIVAFVFGPFRMLSVRRGVFLMPLAGLVLMPLFVWKPNRTTAALSALGALAWGWSGFVFLVASTE